MRRSVIRTLLATAAALGMAAACGARDDGDFDLEFDPGSGGNGARGGSSGRAGGGRGGAFGRGGSVGSDGVGGAFGSDGAGGAFGSDGVGGAFGSDGVGGAFGSDGVGGAFGRGGTFGGAGMFGSGGSIGPDGSVGRGGSAGRGGSSGRGGTGGSVDAGIEDCTNARDDDGDNRIDCADSDCNAGFICTPAAPDGWLGPAALWQGTDIPSPTLCRDNGYQQPAGGGFAGIIADPPACAGCLCRSPHGIGCPDARISFSASSSCAGTTSTLTIPSNACRSFLVPLDARSVRWEASMPAGGSCEPAIDGFSNFPPVRWSRYAAACYNPRPGGGCATGSCLPRASAPFSNGNCIVQTGDVSCPSQYPQRFLYYLGALDTRGCTDCSCAPPSGASCSGQLLVASDSSCSAERSTLRTIGSCAAIGPDPTPPLPPSLQSRSAIFQEGAVSGGSCLASGGDASGSAQASNPITFCCGGSTRFKLPGLRPTPGTDSGTD